MTRESLQRTDLTIVTHRALPNGAPDDILLARALASRGVSVRAAVWDDPDVDWSASTATLIRSCWDYHHRIDDWRRWASQVSLHSRLFNCLSLLRWNDHKRYLIELSEREIPCVPTVLVRAENREAVCALAARAGWGTVVIKPAVGASALGVRAFSAREFDNAGEEHMSALLERGDAIVQHYLREVATGDERCLVFLNGVFGHAYKKPSFSTNCFGSTALTSYTPSDEEISIAARACEAAPYMPLYARVDLIATEAGPVLMELELIEPDLGLRLDDANVNRLADACGRMLDGLVRSALI